MNTQKLVFSLVFIAFFGVASLAHAADDNRYLVKTNSQFWKKSFQVRHTFEDGFTADLSDFQLRLAKMFSIEVQPIRKLSILALFKKSVVKPKTPTETMPWGIRMTYGETLGDGPAGGKDINVAVLDTGVFKNHPDLRDRVKNCADFSGTDTFVENKCEDKNGHGTHIAGVIAANGGIDGKGIHGVAPETNLMIYKVCVNDGTCFADDVAVAVRKAVDSGAHIILFSIGSDAESSLVADAVAYAAEKGVMVVAAGGNDGPYTGSIDYPAAIPGVISVGAIDSNLDVPNWSARGVNSKTKAYVQESKDMEFAAPGVNVESTWFNGEYTTLSGTSMAAAHVAGLAAKAWQSEAKDPLAATRDMLHQFAQDILPAGDDDASGWGIPKL